MSSDSADAALQPPDEVWLYHPDSDAGRAQIDRVARALTWHNYSGCLNFDSPNETDEFRAHMRDQARAALDALREPHPDYRAWLAGGGEGAQEAHG